MGQEYGVPQPMLMGSTTSERVWTKVIHGTTKSAVLPSSEGVHTFLGGLGYVVTRHAITKITEKYNFNNLNSVRQEFIYEDAMVGIILRRYGIRPKKFLLRLKDTRGSDRSSARRNRLRRFANRAASGASSASLRRRRRAVNPNGVMQLNRLKLI